ncbi:MAG: hypothetical protein ACR2LR_16940 [Hassallia sp.]
MQIVVVAQNHSQYENEYRERFLQVELGHCDRLMLKTESHQKHLLQKS